MVQGLRGPIGASVCAGVLVVSGAGASVTELTGDSENCAEARFLSKSECTLLKIVTNTTHEGLLLPERVLGLRC